MKFKKHIADLFDTNLLSDSLEKAHFELVLSMLFIRDPEAEARVHIKGQVYFLQITDMEEDEE